MTKMTLECGNKTLANAINGGRGSILVVDDEPDISAMIKRSAHEDGFEVSTFADPLKALEYFKENYKTCGLILSDIRMPGMNGYEFVKKATI